VLIQFALIAKSLLMVVQWAGTFSTFALIRTFGKLLEVHPDIQKEEGHIIEQQFVLWLSKQFRNKIKSEYHLKLMDVPYEYTKGFRLNPENYRYDDELEKLR
jgi:hypothetical protein